MLTLDLSLLALGVAIVLVGYEMVLSLGPQYRKDCTECAAHKRHAEERQRELDHEYHHKTIGACSDAECSRNPKG